MALNRITGDRNRKLFENAKALKTSTQGHRHLANEISSHQHERAPCVFVSSYRALIRSVGYFKYNSHTSLLLRGQPRCYGTMTASLHRRASPPSDRDVDLFLRRYRIALSVDGNPADQMSTEPLLQHYGIATRWLDVVDSVPHALFFATHVLVPSPSRAGTLTYAPSREKYGYIYLLDTGTQRLVRKAGRGIVGLTRGSSGLLIADLRKLKPSLALRPHAQHGLLVRAMTGNIDLWDRLVARIAVPTTVARRWIEAPAFDPEELFPAKAWDGVFGHLVSAKMQAFLVDEAALGHTWGSVQRFDFHDD